MIRVAITVVLIAGVILSIMGGLLQKKAEKISSVDFENKVKNDFMFAKKMMEKNPENKELYINKNSEYVSSGHDNLESNDESSDVKKVRPLRLVLGAVLALIFIFSGMYLLG